jgi:hypothetical protein
VAFVPAVPEAAAAGATFADLILALGAFLLWIVCLGLLWGYEYTIGAWLQAIASVLSFRVLRVHVDLGGPVRGLDHAVRVTLSKGVSTADHAMGLFFHWASVLIAWMGRFAMLSAHDTLNLARWLAHVHIPDAAKWAAKVTFPVAWLTKLIAQQVAKALPKVVHIAKGAAHTAVTVVEKIPRSISNRLTKAEKRLVALAASIAALGGHVIHPGHTLTLPKSWYGLTKRLARLERRAHRLEGLFAAGVLAAAMANVFGVRASCLRGRGNVARLLRHVCGVPSWLLDLLIVGTVEAFIANDLCDFSDLLIAQAEALRPALMEFVDVENALLACSGVSAHRPLNLPPLSLPPMPSASAFAV